MRSGDVVAILSNGGFVFMKSCPASWEELRRASFDGSCIYTIISFIRSVAPFLDCGGALRLRLFFPWTFITSRLNSFMRLAWVWLTPGALIWAKPKVVGLDKIDPAGTYIFMSNPVTNLDPPLLLPLILGGLRCWPKKRYGAFLSRAGA